jgi:hypothetical protein
MKAKLIKKGLDFYSLVLMDNKELLATTEDAEGALKLSIHNCQTIEVGYDLDELVKKDTDLFPSNTKPMDKVFHQVGFLRGFREALTILGDKKFSEEDMRKSFEYGATATLMNSQGRHNLEKAVEISFEESLQQTEWDVEIVEVENDEVYSVSDTMKVAHNKVFDGVLFKYDENCCLILKRK